MAGDVIRFDSGYRFDEGHRFDEPPAFFLGPEPKKGHMADFIPKSGDGYIQWLTNLAEQLADPTVNFGLTPTQITAVTGRIAGQLGLHGLTETAQSVLDGAKMAEADGKTDLDAFLRVQINNWKLMTDFTDAFAARLRVVGTSTSSKPSSTEIAAMKVKFTAQVLGNEVRLNWVKGPFEAVMIYARVRGQEKWTKIGMDTSSPYLDSRPLPEGVQAEVREYVMRGVINDAEVTGYSDTVTVAFPG